MANNNLEFHKDPIQYKNHKFTIMIHNGILGVFDVSQIIKYITNRITNLFLKNVEYESLIDIIEKYVCKCDDNNIIFISHLESPFTRNINHIGELYSDILYFETNYLINELAKTSMNESEKKLIIQKITEFKYVLANHTLKLIVNISNIIKNDDTKQELKSSLIKYSVYFNNQINNIINENINQKINDYKLLEIEVEQLKKIKEYNMQKYRNIEIMNKKIDEKINKILAYLDIDENDIDFSEFDNENIDQKVNFDQSHSQNPDFKDNDYGYQEETNEINGKTNIGYLSE